MKAYPGAIRELNRMTQELIVHRGMTCDVIEVIAAVYRVPLYLIDSERSILHAYRPDRDGSSMFASLVAIMYNNHLYPVIGSNVAKGIALRAARLFLAMDEQHPPGGSFPSMTPFENVSPMGRSGFTEKTKTRSLLSQIPRSEKRGVLLASLIFWQR